MAFCLVMVPAAVAQNAAKTPAPAAARPLQEGFPFTDETLRFSMNWQSGLSLGEATMTAHRSGGGWDFEVTLNAGVPGFTIADKYSSSTDTGVCSQQLDRQASHGGKRTNERTTFDQREGKARRVTLFPDGGGKSTYDVGSCARDALAFAYYARIELGQGRVPPPQQVLFGSPYMVRMEYGGAQNITVDQKSLVSDKLNVSVKGPKSDSSFEIWFARDPARTPLRIRIPAALGTFTLELVH
ncbi:MAG TPA: DUF3108 domain-containing protein [Bryobacteraceae bacterium]|nr:DUF3108 domain-containing protein [Bryobacteraceae bacterium]